MNKYLTGLQSQISMSAYALSSDLIKSKRKLVKRKDQNLPKMRQPHAYMHNRPIDASDTVSMHYPKIGGSDAGSSIYYASLTTSVHKINGTRKRAHLFDEFSSLAPESLADVILEEENPEEILKIKRAEAKRHRKNKSENPTMIDKLKTRVAMGAMK